MCEMGATTITVLESPHAANQSQVCVDSRIDLICLVYLISDIFLLLELKDLLTQLSQGLWFLCQHQFQLG